ncbi:hypothetical protein M2352_002244 [Azospirillum fermentarium]|uniref:hypothetical protein n=1 Tax=Azospirillum fermentarium TaxID=1233114 RepID=UPI0022274AEC|nr:hypothetical protein [Azospirillum fermentarium]MCW2246653.1 hypothetical protein [Azospirillum fermentarium]
MPSRFTTRSARSSSRLDQVPGWFTVLMLPAAVVVGLIAAMVSFGVMAGVGLARLFTRAASAARRSPAQAAPAARPSGSARSPATVIDGNWTVLSVRDPEYA